MYVHIAYTEILLDILCFKCLKPWTIQLHGRVERDQETIVLQGPLEESIINEATFKGDI